MTVVIDPEIQHGNPCIRGTRVCVYTLLDYLAEGETTESFSADYEVRLEDVRRSLKFVSRLLHGDMWRVIRLHTEGHLESSLISARDRMLQALGALKNRLPGRSRLTTAETCLRAGIDEIKRTLEGA